MAVSGRPASEGSARTQKTTDKVRLELWVDRETKKRLRRLAFDRESSISALVEAWVLDRLEESEKEG